MYVGSSSGWRTQWESTPCLPPNILETRESLQPGGEVGDRVLDVQGHHGRLLYWIHAHLALAAKPQVPQSRNAIQMALRSVNLSSAWIDLSRPKPDCLKPPNGLEMSPASNVLTHTTPARIARAARWATFTSSVQIPAESP